MSFVTTMDCSPPPSSVHGISQASIGLPFPSLEDLPDSGIVPTSPALADGFFTTEPPGKPCLLILMLLCSSPPTLNRSDLSNQ